MQQLVIVQHWLRKVFAVCAFFAIVSIAVMLFFGSFRTAWEQALVHTALGVPIATWLFRMENGLSLRKTVPYVLFSVPVISLLVYPFFSSGSAAQMPIWVVALITGIGTSLAGLLPDISELDKGPQDGSAP